MWGNGDVWATTGEGELKLNHGQQQYYLLPLLLHNKKQCEFGGRGDCVGWTQAQDCSNISIYNRQYIFLNMENIVYFCV